MSLVKFVLEFIPIWYIKVERKLQVYYCPKVIFIIPSWYYKILLNMVQIYFHFIFDFNTTTLIPKILFYVNMLTVILSAFYFITSTYIKH
jgi:hypothetical protein